MAVLVDQRRLARSPFLLPFPLPPTPPPPASLCTMSKRPGEASSALIKRQRVEDDPALQEIVVASDGNSANKGALYVPPPIRYGARPIARSAS